MISQVRPANFGIGNDRGGTARKGCDMVATDLYEVIVVLPPQAAWETLARLDAASGISRFRGRIATGDPAGNPPAWAELADPVDLIGELRYSLSKEAISYLAYAVTSGCGLAELRFVPEASLAAISGALTLVVLSDWPTRLA